MSSRLGFLYVHKGKLVNVQVCHFAFQFPQCDSYVCFRAISINAADLQIGISFYWGFFVWRQAVEAAAIKQICWIKCDNPNNDLVHTDTVKMLYVFSVCPLLCINIKWMTHWTEGSTCNASSADILFFSKSESWSFRLHSEYINNVGDTPMHRWMKSFCEWQRVLSCLSFMSFHTEDKVFSLAAAACKL